jgi:DinB superfamily
MSSDIPETFEGLVAYLARTPAEIKTVVGKLSPQTAVRKPSPEEFSAIENVCHLRDIEIEGYSIRIRKILNEEHPSLPDIDGARLAIERDYNRQNLHEALEAFTLSRTQNVALLSQLNEPEANRTGVMAGVGSITLKKLVKMMAEHDESHIDELVRIGRLAQVSSSW